MLFFCRSSDVKKLQKHAQLPWVYIGEGRDISKVKLVLDENRRILIAQDIDRVSHFVRDNFVNYIGQLSLKQPDKILWYSSPLASKSVSQTTIFQGYVYQKIIEEMIQKYQLKEDLLIVTDSSELIFHASHLWAGQINVLSPARIFENPVGAAVKGWIKFIKYFVAWGFLRFFKNSSLKKYDVFLHSWIDERTFKNVPRFSDPYFCHLEDVLAEKGCTVGRLVPLLPSLKHIKLLRRYFPNIILPLSYLRLSDFLKVFFSKFSVITFQGNLFDTKDQRILDTLLRREILKENSSKDFSRYLLLFYAYKNISAQIQEQITLFYPFENQPWEKMLNLAFGGPNFTRIGYQHTTVPDNWLDYRISSCEKQPLPNRILSCGEEWTLLLKKSYPNVAIKNAGALRFTHLFGEKKQKLPGSEESIVVALPVIPEIAVALQEQVLLGFKEGYFSSSRVIIKPHPYLPRKAQLKNQFLFYDNCEFSDRDMNTLLEKCKLLITTDSSVIFESVFLGIKTLNFIPEQFSIGLESFLVDYLFIAYEQNFLAKLKEALNSSIYPDASVERFFSTPSYNTFLECLPQGGNEVFMAQPPISLLSKNH